MTDNAMIKPKPCDGEPPFYGYELCPGPCEDGDYCFCGLGGELLHQGVYKLQAKWPTIDEQTAVRLVTEQVIETACIGEGPTTTEKFIEMLIREAVHLAFTHNSPMPSEADDAIHQCEAEGTAQAMLENMLYERVGKYRPRHAKTVTTPR